MEQLDAMRVFQRVAELGSFIRASESLGLPRATVSDAVQQLESRLGTRLLHRTTRRVQLTQDGQLFLERSSDLLADFDELGAMFQQQQAAVSGRLRVDMSSGIARNMVLPRLPAFLAAHPGLQLELSSTDRRVDLVREGFDCVVRVGEVRDASLICRPLGRFALANCASPAYLAAHGTPQTLDDLASHSMVHYVPQLGGKPDGFEYLDAAGQRCFAAVAGRLVVNSVDAYLGACLAGMGIIQLPRVAVAAALAADQLREVLPQWQAAPMPVNLLYANRRHQPRRVQLFMNWLDEVIRPYLLPVAG
ncbi:LysR family transcriptional regulator [Vogesella sp. LIG4]|uniref:LysR substrate-binding domain-containing protein n=1 Tax=Vogesella sp. LIG4 TaxID=1192162 RepID=UPI00081FAB0B|nr:LysR family transcriptional regulator [Vogesella sp. LIG4]SCK22472.1 DNA-binding transcriptional regulator, LysR family [Vogesella sp. LIG4]